MANVKETSRQSGSSPFRRQAPGTSPFTRPTEHGCLPQRAKRCVTSAHSFSKDLSQKGGKLTNVTCLQPPGNGDVGGVHAKALRHQDELAQSVVVRSFVSFLLLFCRCCSECAVSAGFLSVFSPRNAVPVQAASPPVGRVQNGIFWLSAPES